MTVTFTGDSIGASSNIGLTLTLPKVNFKTANVPISDDTNILSVEYEAVRSPLEVVLTNEVSSRA